MFLQTDDTQLPASEHQPACLRTGGGHKQPVLIKDTSFGSSQPKKEVSRTVPSIFPVNSLIFRTNLKKKNMSAIMDCIITVSPKLPKARNQKLGYLEKDKIS